MPTETGTTLPNATFTTTESPTPSPTPFWPTAILPHFPADFSDIPDEALACWKSWADYQLRTQVPNPGIIATETVSRIDITFATPSSYYEAHTYCTVTSVNEVPIGLTTLCDGIPRMSSYDRTSLWSMYTWIINRTESSSVQWSIIPGTTISGYENYEPECRLAGDSAPLCDRINAAYSWWLTSGAAPTPAPTEASITETLPAPNCVQTVFQPPGAKPTCAMEVESQEVWYWPTPAPPPASFCNSSSIPITATPTIPGKPNTAVISGLTLTSPSVYYFVKGVTVYGLVGSETRADGSFDRYTNIWNESTTISAPTILTTALLESDIVSATRTQARRARTGTYLYNKDFKLNDLFTMRADPYFRYSSDIPSTSTIVENEVEHCVAVGIKPFVEQNGVFTDCVWTRRESALVYPTPVAFEHTVSRTDWRAIVTTVGEGSSSSSVVVSMTALPEGCVA